MKSVLALALVPALALAKPQGYGGYGPATPASSSAAPATSSAAAGQTITVQVGGSDGISFAPSAITAEVGTLINFVFPSGQQQHSVSQSNFDSPCTPLDSGFDSGLTSGQQFTLNVTSTDPVYFFCKFPLHCGSGMVGTINAPSSGNTHDSFVSAAKKIGTGEQTVQDQGAKTGGVGALATAAPSAVSASGGGNSSGAAKLSMSSIGLLGLVMGIAVLAL